MECKKELRYRASFSSIGSVFSARGATTGIRFDTRYDMDHDYIA